MSYPTARGHRKMDMVDRGQGRFCEEKCQWGLSKDPVWGSNLRCVSAESIIQCLEEPCICNMALKKHSTVAVCVGGIREHAAIDSRARRCYYWIRVISRMGIIRTPDESSLHLAVEINEWLVFPFVSCEQSCSCGSWEKMLHYLPNYFKFDVRYTAPVQSRYLWNDDCGANFDEFCHLHIVIVVVVRKLRSELGSWRSEWFVFDVLTHRWEIGLPNVSLTHWITSSVWWAGDSKTMTESSNSRMSCAKLALSRNTIWWALGRSSAGWVTEIWSRLPRYNPSHIVLDQYSSNIAWL